MFIFSSQATEFEGCGAVQSLWHDTDGYLCVIYPRNSRAFVLQSLLHKHELSATTIAARSMRYLGPGLAEPGHHECSSRKGALKLWECQLHVCLSDSCDSLSETPGWLTVWAQPNEVSSECRIPSRTVNNTRDLVSQEFREWDWSIQQGNGFLAGMVLTRGRRFEHAQQPHHNYVLSKLAGNNTIQ